MLDLQAGPLQPCTLAKASDWCLTLPTSEPSEGQQHNMQQINSEGRESKEEAEGNEQVASTSKAGAQMTGSEDLNVDRGVQDETEAILGATPNSSSPPALQGPTDSQP